MQTTLPQGPVDISRYKALLETAVFSDIEGFSNNFISQNKLVLTSYAKKWVIDPLHQWSRQWEYPFVYSHIRNYAALHQQQPINIIDGGSGMTFFPYYLLKNIPMSSVTCCDTDSTLSSLFNSINSDTQNNVKFLCTDIRKMDVQSGSFDIIYCVSVLEHTGNYSEIIREFRRLLKKDGVLIVTFDISLDGRADIPYEQVRNLIESLKAELTPTDPNSLAILLDKKKLFSPDTLTTQYVSKWNSSLLPWKYPRLSGLISSIKNKKFPAPTLKNLACACHTFVLS